MRDCVTAHFVWSFLALRWSIMRTQKRKTRGEERQGTLSNTTREQRAQQHRGAEKRFLDSLFRSADLLNSLENLVQDPLRMPEGRGPAVHQKAKCLNESAASADVASSSFVKLHRLLSLPRHVVFFEDIRQSLVLRGHCVGQ